jgi:hypothetical protein
MKDNESTFVMPTNKSISAYALYYIRINPQINNKHVLVLSSRQTPNSNKYIRETTYTQPSVLSRSNNAASVMQNAFDHIHASSEFVAETDK